MKKEPTYEELLAEIAILRDQNKRKDELIAYLQRLLYGTKSDRLASKVPENRNHPKRAAFYMTFLLVNFAVKNAMFNCNHPKRAGWEYKQVQ